MKIISEDKRKRVAPVNIEFTEDELDFLTVVMGKISGDPHHSPRLHQRKLTKILGDLGYCLSNCQNYKYLDRCYHGIGFKNYGDEQ